MNTQDQYFEPGTKVCRVAYGIELGLPVLSYLVVPETDKGNVLCVERCWSVGMRNVVSFVGIKPPNGPNEWWAACFRRIEEIQLCVRAAEKFKQNEEVEV